MSIAARIEAQQAYKFTIDIGIDKQENIGLRADTKIPALFHYSEGSRYAFPAGSILNCNLDHNPAKPIS